MRVCIDTNVLISGIFWKGMPGSVVEAWVDAQFDLVVSLPILEEYKRIFQRVGNRIDPDLSEAWVKMIIEKASIVAPVHNTQTWSRDVHDDKFIHCCLAAHADYLVTGDKDLLVLKEQFHFQIVTPKEFLKDLKN